ncbi:MAG: hypothetical protein V1753_07640, partial [Pseudomonadota bacterium]
YSGNYDEVAFSVAKKEAGYILGGYREFIVDHNIKHEPLTIETNSEGYQIKKTKNIPGHGNLPFERVSLITNDITYNAIETATDNYNLYVNSNNQYENPAWQECPLDSFVNWFAGQLCDQEACKTGTYKIAYDQRNKKTRQWLLIENDAFYISIDDNNLWMGPYTEDEAKGLMRGENVNANVIKRGIRIFYDGYDSVEAGYSIKPTDDNGYILSGSIDNILLLIKFDSDWNIEWYKKFTGISSDYKSIHNGIYTYSSSIPIQQTTDGGYIIAAEKKGVTYMVNPTTSDEDSDIWIIKLDSNGKEVWNKTYDGGNKGHDYVYAIQQTTDRGYVMAGSRKSGAYDSDDYSEIWVLKLNANGEKERENYLDGGANPGGVKRESRAFSIQQTNDGGYIVAGRSYANERYTPLVFKLNADLTIAGHYKAPNDNNWIAYSVIEDTTDDSYVVAGSNVLLKLDENLEIKWIKDAYNGRCFDNIDLHSVQKTLDGNYIVVGNATYTFGPYGYWSTSGINLSKVDTNGNIIWSRTPNFFSYSRREDEIVLSIQQDSNGNFIGTGYTGYYIPRNGDESNYNMLMFELDNEGRRFEHIPLINAYVPIEEFRPFQLYNPYDMLEDHKETWIKTAIHGGILYLHRLSDNAWTTYYDLSQNKSCWIDWFVGHTSDDPSQHYMLAYDYRSQKLRLWRKENNDDNKYYLCTDTERWKGYYCQSPITNPSVKGFDWEGPYTKATAELLMLPVLAPLTNAPISNVFAGNFGGYRAWTPQGLQQVYPFVVNNANSGVQLGFNSKPWLTSYSSFTPGLSSYVLPGSGYSSYDGLSGLTSYGSGPLGLGLSSVLPGLTSYNSSSGYGGFTSGLLGLGLFSGSSPYNMSSFSKFW